MRNFKLHWKRPLFYLFLPIFLVMVFLGFPLPPAPLPGKKARQEQAVPAQKQTGQVRQQDDSRQG